MMLFEYFAALLCLNMMVVNASSFGKRRPNILLLVTDQERKAPVYEDAGLAEYRRKYFVGRQKIAGNGMSFENHYITSAACVSSRTCLYTGQHLNLHGVDSTDGVSKPADAVNWMEPNWIPTMGDYLRFGGYDTAYIGKWHISHEDIEVDGHVRQVVDPDGTFHQDVFNAYERENRLDKFGFSNYSGPEPHGIAYENSGTVRDREYTSNIVNWLQQRNESKSEKPWLLAANLVNPHDICLMQAAIWALFQEDYDDGLCPKEIQSPPTRYENLTHHPTIYRQYVEIVNSVFRKQLRSKVWTERDEACFYYFLMKQVDAHIERIYETLKATKFFEDTVVFMTADHGELLNAHGGGIEKWDNAYEETVHIPLVISNPKLFPNGPVQNEHLTSHLDILPTILSLAGIDQQEANEQLKHTHPQTTTLPGKDLTKLFHEHDHPEQEVEDEYVFFYQRDQVFLGERDEVGPPDFFPFWIKAIARTYKFDAPWATNSVQMIVYRHKEDGKRYKFVEFFDDPLKWSHPYVKNEYLVRSNTALKELGPAGTLLVRTERLPSEFQIFCLDDDPAEQVNLYHATNFTLIPRLEQVMEKARNRILKNATAPFPKSNHVDLNYQYRVPPLLQTVNRWLQTLCAGLLLSQVILKAKK